MQLLRTFISQSYKAISKEFQDCSRHLHNLSFFSLFFLTRDTQMKSFLCSHLILQLFFF